MARNLHFRPKRRTFAAKIDEKVNLLSDENRTKIKEILKVIGRGFLQKGYQVIEDKTGIKFEKIVEALKEGGEEAKKIIEVRDAIGINYFDK